MPDHASEKLLPCPFCGATPIEVGEPISEMRYWRCPTVACPAQMHCYSCMVKGGITENGWNRRTPSAAEATARPDGWKWHHEHQRDLIDRDGLMCEAHPGTEWPHGDCPGPGMAWMIEGKEAITKAAATAEARGRREAIEECARVCDGVQANAHLMVQTSIAWECGRSIRALLASPAREET